MFDVPRQHIHEFRITLCEIDGQRMRYDPIDDADNRKLETKPKGSGQSSVENCRRSGCAAKQDWLGQRAVQRYRETVYHPIWH